MKEKESAERGKVKKLPDLNEWQKPRKRRWSKLWDTWPAGCEEDLSEYNCPEGVELITDKGRKICL